MYNYIKQFFSPIRFPQNGEKDRRSQVFYALWINNWVVQGLHVIGLLFFYANKTGVIILMSVMIGLLIASRIHHQRGNIQSASKILVFGLWLIYIIVVVLTATVKTSFITLPIALSATAILLLGTRAGFRYTAATILITLGVLIAEQMGIDLPVVFPAPPTASWFNIVIAFILILTPLNQAIKVLNNALQRARRAEAEFRALNTELEQRVETRTAELEAVNEQLQSFSYSISHDLRAPLRAITGYANILEEDHVAQLDEEGLRYLKQISDNAKTMNQLIQDLLSFSQTTQQEIHKKLTDPKTLIREILTQLQPGIETNHTQITVADDLPTCEADPNLLKQVFSNLLRNSIKYSRQSKPPEIHVGWHMGEEAIVYSVKDNGVGFDMKYADKIFGVFQRLHSATDYEGTGVGLAIVQRIVQQHGGRIWVEAEVNKGATFYFTVKKS